MIHKSPKERASYQISDTELHKGKMLGIIPSEKLNAYSIRKFLNQSLSVLLVLSTSYMFWRGLSLVTNASSPIVVVLSGSMEPAFQRGDILLLSNWKPKLDVGDIVVYEVDSGSIPIVHRVIREHSSELKQFVLTKGDNNPVDDLDLYSRNQMYLDRQNDIVGIVKGYIPKLGYATLLLSEVKWLKPALLVFLALLSAFQKDE